MTKNRKTILWCAAVAAFLLCLIPVKRNYKDGGTVEYRALLYQVTQWHALVEASGNVETFQEGLEIQILGFPVYDGRHLVETRYCEEGRAWGKALFP